MKPQDLVNELKRVPELGLRSVILYGSAAAGDHLGPRSDYNVLVVTDQLGLRELKAVSPIAARWAKAGNPPPLLFTLGRLQKSVDVFPIEILDIQQSHQILFGENVLSEIKVQPENLRLELEREFKSKLIHLRDRFLMTEARAGRIVGLMIESLSTFLVLLRASLRLFQQKVPVQKLEALRALSQEIEFDSEVFSVIEQLKEGQKKPREVEAEDLFARYLKAIESVADAIDLHIHGIRKSGSGNQDSEPGTRNQKPTLGENQ